MINLEVLRLKLNYLKQAVKGILGDKVSGEIGEAIEALTIYFLNPATYNSLSLSHLQTIEQYLNQIQQKTEPYEYKLMLNNIPTIRNFLEKVKFEMPKY
jgi:choline-glycine betaine transporter